MFSSSLTVSSTVRSFVTGGATNVVLYGSAMRGGLGLELFEQDAQIEHRPVSAARHDRDGQIVLAIHPPRDDAIARLALLAALATMAGFAARPDLPARSRAGAGVVFHGNEPARIQRHNVEVRIGLRRIVRLADIQAAAGHTGRTSSRQADPIGTVEAARGIAARLVGAGLVHHDIALVVHDVGLSRLGYRQFPGRAFGTALARGTGRTGGTGIASITFGARSAWITFGANSWLAGRGCIAFRAGWSHRSRRAGDALSGRPCRAWRPLWPDVARGTPIACIALGTGCAVGAGRARDALACWSHRPHVALVALVALGSSGAICAWVALCAGCAIGAPLAGCTGCSRRSICARQPGLAIAHLGQPIAYRAFEPLEPQFALGVAPLEVG